MTDIEKIWKTYHGALRRFIRKRVEDAATADDLLQEVFIKIHAKIDTLKDAARIQGWLYQIARNVIIDHYRRQKKMEALPEELANPKRDDRRALIELAGCVRPMIDRLPAAYRDVLVLSELEGRTQKEVAKAEGLSLSGAKSRVQRGREKLKGLVLECCHVEFDRRGNIADYERKDGKCSLC